MPKNKIKESSSRETAASARYSPRHRLSRMPSSCCKGEGRRLVYGGSGGGGGGPATGGGVADNDGETPPVWAFSLDDSVFGSNGMSRGVAGYNSPLTGSFSPGAPVRLAASRRNFHPSPVRLGFFKYCSNAIRIRNPFSNRFKAPSV